MTRRRRCRPRLAAEPRLRKYRSATSESEVGRRSRPCCLPWYELLPVAGWDRFRLVPSGVPRLVDEDRPRCEERSTSGKSGAVDRVGDTGCTFQLLDRGPDLG